MASAMKQYSSLIVAAKRANRKKLDIGDQAYVYCEDHHIWPKCFGRDDRKQNLVLLTFAEHVDAHVLLAKLYPKAHKIQNVAARMLTDKKGEVASVEVATEARSQAAAATTERNILLGSEGSHPSQKPENREALRIRNIETAAEGLMWVQSSEGKAIISERMLNWSANGELWIQSPDGRDWIGERNRQWHADGKHPSQKPENREAVRLRNKEQVQCPHCCISGGQAGMRRSHFDYCKLLLSPGLSCGLSEAEKWLPCSDCNMFYKNKRDLTKHRSNKHKPVSLSDCLPKFQEAA